MAPAPSSIYSHACTSLSSFSPYLLHGLHFRPFSLVSSASNLSHHSFPTAAPPPIRSAFASRLKTTTNLLSTKNSSSSLSIRPINLLRHLSFSASSMSGGEEAQPVPPPYDEDDDPRENDYVNDWHIVMEPPEGNPTKDEIIDSYIKTLASVVGCDEEKASGKMSSVSTKYYHALSANISKRHAYKISKLPNVRTVIPDHISRYRWLMFAEQAFCNSRRGSNDEYYEEHKKILLEGNYNIGEIPTTNMVCPPNMRGFFPKMFDLGYWHVVMESLHYRESTRDRDEIINGYIKTLATVISGREEEATTRMRLVSTKYYYAFNAYFYWKDAYKMNILPNVKTVVSAEFTRFWGDIYSHDEDPKYCYNEHYEERAKKVLLGVDNMVGSSCPPSHRGISLNAYDLKRRYDVLKRDGCRPMNDPTRGELIRSIGTLPSCSNNTEEEVRTKFYTRYRYAFGAIVIDSVGHCRT